MSSFEAIPHSGLMAAIEERISDRHVLKLLRAMLRAGVMEDGAVTRSDDRHPAGRGDDCSHATGNLGYRGLWGWGWCVGW